jgi:hypothetical protein
MKAYKRKYMYIVTYIILYSYTKYIFTFYIHIHVFFHVYGPNLYSSPYIIPILLHIPLPCPYSKEYAISTHQIIHHICMLNCILCPCTWQCVVSIYTSNKIHKKFMTYNIYIPSSSKNIISNFYLYIRWKIWEWIEKLIL